MQENTNTASDLTTLLFETLRGVKSGAIKVDQAKAISDLSGRIIDVSKTEIEFAKVTKQQVYSQFFPQLAKPAGENGIPRAIESGTVVKQGNVLTHKMGGK